MHIAILCISAVAICTERVEAKKILLIYHRKGLPLQSARSVWRQRPFLPGLYRPARYRCNLHGACGGKAFAGIPNQHWEPGCNLHGACGGKAGFKALNISKFMLQSARSVWRQRIVSRKFVLKIKLQSARSVWRQRLCEAGFRYSLPLQSARSVWRQRCTSISSVLLINRCNLHGACGGKDADISLHFSFPRCNLHGACGGKVVLLGAYNTFYTLQSARGVWKTLHHPPEKNPRKFMQTYCIFIHLAV